MSRSLRNLGALLALLLMSWVLYANLGRLSTVNLSLSTVWPKLLAALGLYVLSQCLAACAWRRILWTFGEPAKLWRTESQLLVAQVGKYLPGNVGHLIGRLALARRDGVAASVAGVALMLEMAVSVSVGLLIVGAAWLCDPATVKGMTGDLLQERHAWGLAGLAGLVLCAALLLYLWRRVLRRAAHGARAWRWIDLLPVLGASLLSFAILGGSVWYVAQSIQPDTPVSFALCMVTFAVAWVLGFITPGAPGGLGIRDALVALGMASSMGAPAALVLALVHRSLSIIGDVCAFVIGWMLRTVVHAQALDGVGSSAE